MTAHDLFSDTPPDEGTLEAIRAMLAAAGGIKPPGQFDAAVAEQLEWLRVRHRARELFDAEIRGPMPAFDVGTLAEILDRPPEPPMRVEGFLPTGGRLLLVAQRKTGKTTLGLNLALSLLDGGHFLGRFPTRAVDGNVAVLNYELAPAMLAGWAQQVGIPGERLLLVNLRGRRNPLGHLEDRAQLVELLRRQRVEALLVDPFGRAYTGKSQNDPGEVMAWLAELDRFAAEAGVAELVLSVHAGWVGERTRGASSLEDWADVIAMLTRDPDDDRLRFLSAFGRDVEVDEDRLYFEPATRTLTLTGAGSRKRGKVERAIEEAMPKVFDYIAEHPRCSGNEIRENVDGNNGVIDRARQRLVELGQVIEEPRAGRGGGKCYRILTENEPRPGTPEPRPAQLGTAPTASYRGAVPKGAVPEQTALRLFMDPAPTGDENEAQP